VHALAQGHRGFHEPGVAFGRQRLQEEPGDLSRRNFRRLPRSKRLLAMGPVWYEKGVNEWEAKEEGRARDKSKSRGGGSCSCLDVAHLSATARAAG
jgi:hypothetical protein